MLTSTPVEAYASCYPETIVSTCAFSSWGMAESCRPRKDKVALSLAPHRLFPNHVQTGQETFENNLAGAKSSSCTVSMKTIDRLSHRINSAEGQTPHKPSSVICMRLTARVTYSDSSLYDSDSLCSTVATSSELMATVDRDGHSINSTAGA